MTKPDDIIECRCGTVVLRTAEGLRWLWRGFTLPLERVIHLCPRVPSGKQRA